MSEFSETYLDHFSSPRNIGEIENADAVAEAEHEGGGCFDRIRVSIRIADGRVEEMLFKARACSGTIAAASAGTEWAKGKTVEEVAEVTADIIADYLDGVPEKKLHSVELVAEVLQKVARKN
ncbi:iron-sulfur cluster assembly scaffold protein [bacterium]|nr:iron-sulfur cluster assembly scaffold protein [bacterium]